MENGSPHPLLPDTSAALEVGLGVLLIMGGLVSLLFGVYEDYYYWGILPVSCVMPIGLVIGLAMVGDGVRRFGGVGSTFRVFKTWWMGRLRWWIAGAAVALTLGVVVLWELYDAPQGVRVVGLPDAEVTVDVPGPEGYEHHIPAGGEAYISVERGKHVIAITVDGQRQDHEVVHTGWATRENVVINIER